MKPRYYYCNTYRQCFYFLIGAKPQAVVKFIKDKFDIDYDGVFDAAKCIEVTSPKGNALVIWTWRKLKDPRLGPDLSHECLHAANYTLESRGVIASFKNDEPQAYLLTELMEQALGLAMKPKA